jgi:hypothetical protein
MAAQGTSPALPSVAARRRWEAPRVEDLPRLTELTLVTGDAIDGACSTAGGGSTCF